MTCFSFQQSNMNSLQMYLKFLSNIGGYRWYFRDTLSSSVHRARISQLQRKRWFILGKSENTRARPSSRFSRLSLLRDRIMALKQCLLSCIVITISIAPLIAAWNSDIHRYESYNLERGPVIYEAYYPDNNEESRNVPEKRYFDREAVLEKTYQLPSQRLVYSESPIGFNGYPNERVLVQDTRDDLIPQAKSLDIREISSLARRAISRDLENWNTLEQYLDRVNYQDPYRRDIDPNYRIKQSIRGIEPKDSLKQNRDLRRELYEEIREEPLQVPIRLEDQRDSMRMLRVRDLTGRDPLSTFGSVPYQNQSPEPVAKAEEPMSVPIPKQIGVQEPKSDPYPTENIFAPRPQVINYIFSRKPEVPEESKTQSVPETKDTELPRNYGDNLIRDEIKKTEENKDVKVTSIEVSEVPRHKTRHHHGEWPKRDYPRHRQS
ncbi:uncharacterized protein LOC100878649 [Megachile rotundata]|uniref:uncharacterized protein LOC100878649 n=1 Tax=Megachile rotundata TaxID=143995 RepID=UPI000614ADB5|nr:PREDICTED: uncharacterized protein LOC100878649 [Megachile rotundata]